MVEAKSLAIGVLIPVIIGAIFVMLPVTYETVTINNRTVTDEVLVERTVSFPSPFVGKMVEFRYEKPFDYEMESDRTGDIGGDIEIWVSNLEEWNEGTFDIQVDYNYMTGGGLNEDNYGTSIYVERDSTEYLYLTPSDVGVSDANFYGWEDVYVDPPVKTVTEERYVEESTEGYEKEVNFLDNVSYEVREVSREIKSGIFLDILRGKGRFTGFGF